ncbi:ribonuclease H-like domain-containing protein [Tanacetum coccineum]
MTTEEIQATKRTKAQIQQEEAGLAEAMRLQALQEEEAARQIIRKDGSDKIYMSFGAIIKDFSREDLTELYRLVIKKYGANRLKEMYDSVYRNKKDERGIVVRNKTRLVAQGYTQEEGIDYDEVFALVARIESIRLFLAYASFMGFIVYQMDVKSAFLYGTIEEEVYVRQPPGFKDPQFPNKVYKIYTQTSKMAEQDTPPPTITAMKIPIIKKGEYDIWSMRMRQYICHTDHNLWDIIVNGDLQEEPAPTGDQSGPSAPPVPKTAKQLAAKRNQERVKSILLLAIPDEYLLKFHNVPDAKSLWEAIKSRFGGNEESKKMQKNVLKHQFENFTTAPNESLDKAYDRFQKLISQLEVYAAPVSKEDINQNFLRSLPPSWSQIALIMRNKPNIDQTDIDDLYNNLRVYEDEMKRSLSSTSNSQNLAFLSSENTSRTKEVSTASGDFGVSTAGRTSHVSSTPCADEQIDEDDLEELDLRWQVAMLTVKVRKFI